jgi:hypothetical protein
MNNLRVFSMTATTNTAKKKKKKQKPTLYKNESIHHIREKQATVTPGRWRCRRRTRQCAARSAETALRRAQGNRTVVATHGRMPQKGNR